jgi:hypothetical protein
MLKLLFALVALFNTTESCETFQVAPGTGCAWMCDYCASKVGPDFYFTTPVCTYTQGGCVGNPLPNVPYTCCEAAYDEYNF